MSKKKLNLDQIKDHWKNWAITYGPNLRATTKTSTAKKIEIATLHRLIKDLSSKISKEANILEVGCGNGHNIFALSKFFPKFKFHGVDFIPEMISSANNNLHQNNYPSDLIKFSTGDVMNLCELESSYDLAFTVRCLINLNTYDLQLQAIRNICNKIKKGGYLLMLENSQSSYDKQNYLRESVGLPKRTPADFNLFFCDKKLVSKIPSLGLKEILIDNFSSLHDLVLYILLPMANDGDIDYEDPIVDLAAKLSIEIYNNNNKSFFCDYGQNRAYLYQKI